MHNSVSKTLKIKSIAKFFGVFVGLIGLVLFMQLSQPKASAQDSGRTDEPHCVGNVVDRFLCQKMINLRSQIFALETQSEIMQVNRPYLAAIGRGLVKTAEQALQILGSDLPQHRQSLVGVILMGEQLADYAEQGDGRAMAMANTIRTNCAGCHSNKKPPADIGWDDIFMNDWTQIQTLCRQPGKNPYLCRSMHALLATQTYNSTAYEGHIENFEMTTRTAEEIIRILNDLKAKGFRHLPDDKRIEATTAAEYVLELSAKENPIAFEKARNIIVTCANCHSALNSQVKAKWTPQPF